MTDDQIKHMVNRFLGWRLPEDFSPDAGISFNPQYNVEFNEARGKPPAYHEPVGTNLFTAPQAEAMVRYLVEGLPSETEVERLREVLKNVMPMLAECDCIYSDRAAPPCPCKAARTVLAQETGRD